MQVHLKADQNILFAIFRHCSYFHIFVLPSDEKSNWKLWHRKILAVFLANFPAFQLYCVFAFLPTKNPKLDTPRESTSFWESTPKHKKHTFLTVYHLLCLKRRKKMQKEEKISENCSFRPGHQNLCNPLLDLLMMELISHLVFVSN